MSSGQDGVPVPERFQTEIEGKQGDGIEQLAQNMAARQSTTLETDSKPFLIQYLDDLERASKSVYLYFREIEDDVLATSHAAEWTLDNYYIIQRELRQIRQDLPFGYYKKLPKVQSGPLAGYPRVFELAAALVGYENADLSIPELQRFVKTYQAERALTMGELWALPSMIRFVLLTVLVRALVEITKVEWDQGSIVLQLAPDLAEINRDAIVADSFTSLRKLAAHDWKDFFEEHSVVEQVLRTDPVGIYPRLDFDTRDHYRAEVEDLALVAGVDEVEIARRAIKFASRHQTEQDGAAYKEFRHVEAGYSVRDDWSGLKAPRQSHVGYFLIADGRKALEREVNYRPSRAVRLARGILDNPLPVYIMTIALITIAFIWLAIGYVSVVGGTSGQMIVAFVLGIIPATTVAVSLVNATVTRIVPPRILPKLNFESGIPESCSTIVVVPSILSDEVEIASLVQEIELHYLRNPDPNLGFALLTDFPDANYEYELEDEEMVEKLIRGIRGLNERYSGGGNSFFYLFHRRRQWNPSENVWMGWERKRGKLVEFNRLLSGREDTTFYIQEGDLARLAQVRYVITLDVDTILPQGSAARMVATLAHPLNRARFDSGARALNAGYTFLQPRTEIKPTSANKSLFTRIYSGDIGLDLYTRAVSDVYQDLFGDSIFVGKGIYDVKAFEHTLEGRVPENALLSHDLFEGIHGRVGLVSDIVLYEDFPSNYIVYIHRLHRWTRGDWQLLPWLLPYVPRAGEGFKSNDLSGLGIWKILDNLRRSLLPPALLALFLAGWFVLPGSPFLWTLVGVLTLAVPVVTGLLSWYARQFRSPSQANSPLLIRDELARWMLGLVFLPAEALIILDAVATTLIRLLVTRKHLLEWTTAARTSRLLGKPGQVTAIWMQMSTAVILTIGLGLLVFFIRPTGIVAAAPLLLSWLISPLVASRISQPVVVQTQPLSAEEHDTLRKLARLTWLYFEQFVGPEDHWLPPDHFQEYPRGLVAHRTSPTNIGLLLTATLSAYDFGYVDLLNLLSRIRLTLDTLGKLERHRGHFLNWYNTRNLEPLPPRYVSMVDSGNLAACLLVTKQACLELPGKPLLRWERWQGLLDLLDLLRERINHFVGVIPTSATAPAKVQLDVICRKIAASKDDPSSWAQLLLDLFYVDVEELDRCLRALIEDHGHQIDSEDLRKLRRYVRRLYQHLEKANREMGMLLPWLERFRKPPDLFKGSLADLGGKMESAWLALLDSLPATPDLSKIIEACNVGEKALNTVQSSLADLEAGGEFHQQIKEAQAWCVDLREEIGATRMSVRAVLIGIQEIVDRVEKFIEEIDFGFLYDDDRQIFHIGYNLDAGRLDPNYYDLLASESRIGSLVAIAKRNIPSAHWLHLGRPITQVEGKRVLLSWSATMFEYLMPEVFMKSYEDTLLHQSCLAAVDHQIAYGLGKGVPWGISESGFYSFDTNMNYQYRAFGVPGLGFKRGLEDYLVISPYASLIALSVRPQAVIKNLEHLQDFNMLGTYGLYEALDFTDSHLPLGQEHALVRSYMAHHQGLIMMSLANYLQDKRMIRRFHADPRIQSVEILLQELVPRAAPLEQLEEEEGQTIRPVDSRVSVEPWNVPVQTPVPQVQVLSNGRFSTFLSAAGGGYSSWKEIALTRWRSDTTLDAEGVWIYVKDLQNQNFWSIGRQPTGTASESYSVNFYAHKAEIQRFDDGISLKMEVVIPPDEDLEIRNFTLTNHTDNPRRLRIASYGEVVLNEMAADRRHPAFTKLFVESEFVPELNGLLFRRRPRSSQEDSIFLAHVYTEERVIEDNGAGLNYESDRARMIGRGRSARSPAVFCDPGVGFTGTTGATLDPVMSLSRDINLDPHQRVHFAFITLAAGSRDDATALATRYQDWSLVERATEQARSQSEVEMRRLGLTARDLTNIQQLQSVLFYPHKALRASVEILASNQLGQSSLWGYEISGDHPIVLLAMEEESHLDLLAELLRAHTYWRNRGLKIDLVILNQLEMGYAESLSGQIFRLIERMESGDWLKRRGGIFILREKQMADSEVVLLKTAACAVINGHDGPLAEQLKAIFRTPTLLPPFVAALSEAEVTGDIPALKRPEGLVFDNGIGGFSQDGREYMVYLAEDDWTPAPWVNVISNEHFGFLVSEAGSGFTWFLNSGENRLTAWKNDPVSDPPAEAIYLRDEETGFVWSPTPLPARTQASYLVRHGGGYTIFEHHSQGLKQYLQLFAVPDEPLKIARLGLENTWKRVRRITVTYYAEWVLGNHRDSTQMFIIPEFDAEAEVILARNPYNAEFRDRVAFLASDRNIHGLTTDRAEFLGRMGNYAQPAAMSRIGLSGNIEPGSDPCAALQVHLDLQPGESVQVHFLVGQGGDRSEVRRLVERYRQLDEIDAAWHSASEFWDHLLGTVQVHTPEPAMNLMLNRWLPYQALSCRIWGRSALYQSSGAYGFRDQLQDVMALLFAAPQLARDHILKAASHQFEEGDVLHWWHPPSGRGVRTRISDDLLWLPFVTAEYLLTTGDESILDEEIAFRKAPELGPNEEERYGLYPVTHQTYSLYEHCLRALKRAATTGPHSLPLMGTGDWNDGMNRVGIRGHGESVWLAWFLRATLLDFSQLCAARDDAEHASLFRLQADEYEQAIQAHAWDGEWFLRAYYDNGSPLGSSANQECQIDSIAQSWAVLSNSEDKNRFRVAMESVFERLIREDDRLILLFSPPFNKSPRDPGYIKGYPPGIRENGGQYTHAAIWSVWAYACMGQGDRAEMLFRLLNPIYHSDTHKKAFAYKVEPYVIAADVYGVPPHTGRGGWTWYTGSSGWYYRLGLQAILGLKLVKGGLKVEPCIPSDWPGYQLTYCYGRTIYNIIVDNPQRINYGVKSVELDGKLIADHLVPLNDDGVDHAVRVILGKRSEFG